MRIRPAIQGLIAVLCAGCAAPRAPRIPAEILTPPLPSAQEDLPREEEEIDLGGLGAAPRDFHEEPGTPEDRRETILSAARALLPDPSRAEREGDRLRVCGTAGERRRVRDMVDLLRRPPEVLFTVTVAFLSTPARPQEPPRVQRLSFAGSLRPTLQAAAALAGAPTLQMPRLTLLNGQRGHVSIHEEQAYVGQHEIRFDARGNAAIDPVIGVLKTGTTASVRPWALSRDGREVLLHELRLSVSGGGAGKLDRLETPLGPVEIPRVATFRCRMDLPIAGGEGVLVGPLPTSDLDAPDRALWVLVTCAPAREE